MKMFNENIIKKDHDAESMITFECDDNATITLHPDLLSCWEKKKDFSEIMQTAGMVYREIETRITLKFVYNDQYYFIKKHKGTTAAELIKNLVFGRLPIIGANNEVVALNRLKALGIRAPIVVGFGEKGSNCLKKQSFIITREVPSVIGLDSLESAWSQNQISWRKKQNILKEVVERTRTLHENGINHRDLYACHFMLPESFESNVNVTLMDLHRAGIHQKIPVRWIIKDLASLYYSLLNFRLTQRDIYRFMEYYSGQSWKAEIKQHNQFWNNVKKRTKHFVKRHSKFFATQISGE